VAALVVAVAVAVVVGFAVAIVVETAGARGAVPAVLLSLAQAESTITAASVSAPVFTSALLCSNQTVHPACVAPLTRFTGSPVSDGHQVGVDHPPKVRAVARLQQQPRCAVAGKFEVYEDAAGATIVDLTEQ
jgi:hypothetical protein